MKKFQVIFLITALVAILLPDLADAQCAMCSATNESALNEGEGLGINEGIIYLMGIPYLLFAILGYVFFRKKISGFFQELKEIHN